jgi:hypothetical protein
MVGHMRWMFMHWYGELSESSLIHLESARLLSGDRSCFPIQGKSVKFQGLVFNCSIVVSNQISKSDSPHK